MFWADTKTPCENIKKLYLYSEMIQLSLKQIINCPVLLSHFSLNGKPRLEDVLYQQLKLRVEIEDSFIQDNSDEFEQ